MQQQYGKHTATILHTEEIFNQCINAERISDFNKEDRPTKSDSKVLKRLINHKLERKKNAFPIYVNQIFSSFVEQKKHIKMDRGYFDEISAKKAYPMGINIVVYAMTH